MNWPSCRCVKHAGDLSGAICYARDAHPRIIVIGPNANCTQTLLIAWSRVLAHHLQFSYGWKKKTLCHPGGAGTYGGQLLVLSL